MSQFVPKENGVPIRQPSTANLMIDSADRGQDSLGLLLGSANDFQIARSNSILNGFFTRVGTTEIVLEWQTPNFSPTADAADTVSIIYTAPTDPPAYNAPVPSAFYTQAQLVDLLARYLNLVGATTTPATTWTVVTTPSTSTLAVQVRIVPNQTVTVEIGGTLGQRLRITPGPQVVDTTGIRIFASDLRLYRYIDFISTQLTYNQALKDASTAQIVRDVLARWYFAFDEPPTFDTYGFPILMGYTPFVLRRTFSPPKQIRWESNIPIGNLSFQVYQPNGELALMTDGPLGQAVTNAATVGTNWLMTLQVSEI